MNREKITMRMDSFLKSGRAEMWLRIALAMMSVFSVFAFVRTVGASGATQFSGTAYFANVGDPGCEDAEGQDADFANNMTGDLQGCLYVYVDSWECLPSGTYIESGHENYVGSGEEGDAGTFETTYVFTAKYEDCSTLSGPIFGSCQHPVVAGSGTGDYKGVTGRFRMIDDAEAGNIPYKGHLKFG
ncbi:MAG: hypothetical protein ACK2UJ_08910 [Candidatus Promineifilaceae bacterium]|jgi:hypothetical protein